MVSIIIPVYNVEKYLQKCINSVINQTYADLEIILVDDGSTDKSGEICERYSKFDNRIVVVHKKNGGLSSARNVGLTHANGDQILFVDSDDFIDLDAVEILLRKKNIYKADIVISNFFYTYEDKEILYKELKDDKLLTNKEAMNMLLTGQIENFAWGKLIDKSIAKKFKFPENKLFEDQYWAHLIMGEANKILLISNPLTHYTQRDDSISFTFSEKRLDILQGWYERKKYIEKNYSDLIDNYMTFISSQYISLVWHTLMKMKGKKKSAIKKLRDFSYKTSLKNYATEKNKKLIYLFEKNSIIFILIMIENKILNKLFV